MIPHPSRRAAALLLTTSLVLPALGRAQTVDYPSSTLASPPQVAFPFYTPGSGSTGATVRAQFLCTDAFLATQNLTAGLVTRIGFSLAGAATYDVFELRAGTSTVATLGADWALNLPDQRVQKDLANVPLHGGGTAANPVNQWVELDLDFPFHWQPGQAIVVDLVTHLGSAGTHLGTTVGAGVPRAYNFAYTPGASATSFAGAGVAFRLVFASTDLVTFGAGCVGQSGVAPSLSASGAATLGGTLVIHADQALDGALGGFLLGGSRTAAGATPLPLALGGGCALLVAPDVFAAATVAPVGGGLGTASVALAVPFDPLLLGAVLYTQWAQFDAATPASVPLTFSNGGIVVVW